MRRPGEKSYFDLRSKYNERAKAISKKLGKFFAKVLDEEAKDGYSPRELEYIAAREFSYCTTMKMIRDDAAKAKTRRKRKKPVGKDNR